MKLSYNEATAKGCSDLLTDLELCEKAGFDYIEIRLDMLEEYLREHTVGELAKFFKTSRLKPHAMNALYLYPEFLSDSDDAEKQRELMNEFLFGCEVSKAIGSHYFIIVPPLQRDPLGGPFIGDKEKTFADCVRILSKLSDIAEYYDINLCFELVGFNRSSVRSISEADRIIRAVNRKNVGFVFDSYNIYLNGRLNDFSQLQAVEPDKIFAVHLISGLEVPDEEMGQDKRCFCDRGVVDIDNFLGNLKKTGYQGMVSVETFNPDYWKQAPQQVIHEAFQTLEKKLLENKCI
ncbi:sugar phosphate isomerase/epimerase family protein [Lacrimispora sp.]|uniref:sugar phosphate isomerase/epimerase family protein n=1 Tax=Lacrimispora sp. TaxID=2719234 RepID=UPI003460F585